MRRRDFIKVIAGSVFAWPFAARAQPSAMPVIGFLGTASADEYAHFMPGFHRGLSETGYIEGQNVALESRFAENHVDRLQALAAELIEHRVAVIFGATFLSTTTEGKRLALLHELAPQASLVTVLIDPDFPDAETQRRQLQETAGKMDIQLQFSDVSVSQNFDAVFATIARQHAGAVFVAVSGLFTSRRDQLVGLAARFGLPASYSYREFTEAGGLMSYGSNLTDGFRQAGLYAGLILKGTRPGDLPVVQPTKFELAINLKTAKSLSLKIPPTLLALADEVIE